MTFGITLKDLHTKLAVVYNRTVRQCVVEAEKKAADEAKKAQARFETEKSRNHGLTSTLHSEHALKNPSAGGNQIAPRLAFFSPIAHENLNSPHLPDGSANNANLRRYTDSMRRICEEKDIPFYDLFTITEQL